MGEDALTNNNNLDNVSISTILKDLMAKERRSHILAIVILSPTLYILGKSNIIDSNFSAMAFISLMAGYSITALIAINEKTRPFVEKTIDPDQIQIHDTFGKKVIFNLYYTAKIITIPLVISATIFLLLNTLMGENKPLSTIGDLLPVILSCLFIFWSVSQATSYKGSVGEWIANKIERNNEEVAFDIKKNTIMQMVIVGISIGIVSSLMLSLLGDEDGLNSPNSTPIVILFVLISQGFILWNSKDIRKELMNRKDGKKFEFTWGIALQLFAAWHFLSIYRRVVSSENVAFNLFEETILMIFTVIMSIWTMSSKGMKGEYNLFVSENTLFWGIAFGFGYSGSVTMLAVGLEGNISYIFAIGHFVTWVALLALHKQTCKDFLKSRV